MVFKEQAHKWRAEQRITSLEGDREGESSLSLLPGCLGDGVCLTLTLLEKRGVSEPSEYNVD